MGLFVLRWPTYYRVVVPDVEPLVVALPAGTPLMSLAEVVPEVVLEVVPAVVPGVVLLPAVVLPVVPLVVALPAGTPLMSLAEVVPLVVRGVVPPEAFVLSVAVHALKALSDTAKSTPVSFGKTMRCIGNRKMKSWNNPLRLSADTVWSSRNLSLISWHKSVLHYSGSAVLVGSGAGGSQSHSNSRVGLAT